VIYPTEPCENCGRPVHYLHEIEALIEQVLPGYDSWWCHHTPQRCQEAKRGKALPGVAFTRR
jgi:hypothetical protein